MEDLFSLLFLGFIIWSMIGGAIGKKKPKQQPRRDPGRPRPGADPDTMGTQHEHTPQPSAGHEDEELSAADMIPDELWTILTGQTRKPSPRPTPPADPEPTVTPEWEASPHPLPPPAEPDPTPDPGWETTPYPDPPTHETEPLPPAIPEATPATLKAPRRVKTAPIPRTRRGRTPPPRQRSLRRAVVLREVLGPPKALQ